MGGGSSDAAAALRLAAHAAGMRDPARARRRGSAPTSPACIRPGRVLMTGAGEHVDRLPATRRRSACSCCRSTPRSPPPTSTARPTASASRARTPSSRSSTPQVARRIPARVHNDLQDAARSLCPAIDAALDFATAAGADHALVSGSGPTVVGLFSDPDDARGAATGWPRAFAAEPVDEEWARVAPA